MGAKTKNLYNEQDNSQSVQQIVKALMSRDSIEAEDCPWVKVGQLYLSLSITGEKSWLPLVRLLHANGQKKFSVFSGRHGDIPNGVDNLTGITQGVFDEHHMVEDTARQKEITKELTDITVDLIDTSKHQKNQTAWLKQETTTQLGKGHAVIFAWCYSIFTMCEHDGDAPKQVVLSNQQVEIAKSVASLVRDYYAWAPRNPFPSQDPAYSYV